MESAIRNVNCGHGKAEGFQIVMDLLEKYFKNEYISNNDHADAALSGFWKSLSEKTKTDYIDAMENCIDCEEENYVEMPIRFRLAELNM